MALITKLSAGDNVAEVPKLYRHRLVVDGTYLQLDFGHSYCYRKTGNPANNDTVYNLTEASPNGTIASASMAYSGGGLVAPNFTANNNIALGTAFIPDNHSYLGIIWVKSPSANTNAFRGIFGRSASSPSGSSFTFTNGVTNGAFNWDCKLPGFANVLIPGIVADTIYQLAFSLEIGSTGSVARYFKNGAEFTNAANTATTLAHVAGVPMGIGKWGNYGQMAGTFYQATLEDLTLSGRNPAAVIALDYASHTGDFS